MLKAMLDASGRLSNISRQASDLAAWCTTTATPPASQSIEAGALLDQMVARLPAAPPRVQIDAADRRTAVRTIDPAMLATALGALAESAAREATGAAITVAAGSDAIDPGVFTVAIGPADRVPTGSPLKRSEGGGPVRFDRGGLGLSLVLASYVLDAHGARATADDSGVIAVRLQKDRGPA